MDKILSPDSRILLDYILLFLREEVFSKSSFVNMLLYSFDFLRDISNLYDPFIYIFLYKGSGKSIFLITHKIPQRYEHLSSLLFCLF